MSKVLQVNARLLDHYVTSNSRTILILMECPKAKLVGIQLAGKQLQYVFAPREVCMNWASGQISDSYDPTFDWLEAEMAHKRKQHGGEMVHD